MPTSFSDVLMSRRGKGLHETIQASCRSCFYEGLLATGLTKIPPGESGNLHNRAPGSLEERMQSSIFLNRDMQIATWSGVAKRTRQHTDDPNLQPPSVVGCL